MRNLWLMRNFYIEYSGNPIRKIARVTGTGKNVAAKAQDDGTVPAFFLRPCQVPRARSSGCTLHKVYQ
jgi:hypothetical protein